MEYFSRKSDVVEEIFKNSLWSIKYDIEKSVSADSLSS